MVITASKPIRKRRQTRARRCTLKNAYTRFFTRVQYGPNLYAGYFGFRMDMDPTGLNPLSQQNFDAIVAMLGLTAPANFGSETPTQWLQRQLGVDADNNFGAGSMLAAMQRIVAEHLSKCRCLKDGTAEEIEDRRKEVVAVAATAFGEFGTHRDIGRNFRPYADAVAWNVRARMDSRIFPHSAVEVTTTPRQYSAHNRGGTAALHIAQYAFDQARTNDRRWRELRGAMNHNAYVQNLRNLIIAIDSACHIFGPEVPEAFRGITHYYSPSGMAPGDYAEDDPGRFPSTWGSQDDWIRHVVPGVDEWHFRGFRPQRGRR